MASAAGTPSGGDTSDRSEGLKDPIDKGYGPRGEAERGSGKDRLVEVGALELNLTKGQY